MYLVLMVITLKITLVDYIRWFADNHVVSDLDSHIDGVIVSPVGIDFLIRLGSVKDGSVDRP